MVFSAENQTREGLGDYLKGKKSALHYSSFQTSAKVKTKTTMVPTQKRTSVLVNFNHILYFEKGFENRSVSQ